jgi:chromosome segregation ATPase
MRRMSTPAQNQPGEGRRRDGNKSEGKGDKVSSRSKHDANNDGNRRNDVVALLESQSEHLTSIAAQSRKLLAENERLRASNRDLHTERDDLQHRCAALSLREEEMEMESPTKRRALTQNDKLTEDNLIFTEQTAILSSEVEQLQATIVSRDESILSLQQTIQSCSHVNDSAHLDLQQLTEEKRSCEEKLVAGVSRVQEHRDECTRLNEELESSKCLTLTLQSHLHDVQNEQEALQQETDDLRLSVSTGTCIYNHTS